MALTKVSGHIIDQPFDVGIITATNQYVSGIGTFGNIRVLGDLQIDGTTTTLDTVVTEVDRLEVGANNSTVGVAITQSGTGDILNLYDGSTEVFSVADGGDVSIIDKIVHTGDTNTAIRFPAADTVTVETGGSERLRITSNGNIGIGTDNPGRLLHAKSSGSSVVGNFECDVQSFTSVDLTNTGGSARITSLNDDLLFSPGSLEKFRITAAGKVGIGTDTISDNLEVFAPTNASLQIKGGNTGSDASRTAQLKLLASGSKLYVMEADATDGSFRILDSSTERLRLDSSGNLMVGQTIQYGVGGGGNTLATFTNSANHRTNLAISNQNSGSSAGAALALASYGVDWIFESTSIAKDSKAFTITEGTNERLRITSGGSVGIGTDTPGTTKLKIETGSGTRAISLNAPTNGTYITFETAGTAYADIGAEKGVVGSGSADTPVINARGIRDLAFRTNATERFRITSAGEVRVPDGGKFTAGASDDLQIYHNSGNFIKGATLNNLFIDSQMAIQLRTGSNDKLAIACQPDAEVQIWHNQVEKFRTLSTGVRVTGALEVTQEYPSIRPTLDLNFAATKSLDRRITFTRDSVGTFTDDMGIVRYASNNVPRFDHDPTTGESLGLLIEESRTNDFAHSDAANSAWLSDGGITKTANTTDTKAPDGSFTATKLASEATANSHSQIYDGMSKSSGGVQSFWAKKGTHNVIGIYYYSGSNGIAGWFDLNTGEHRCEGGSKVAAGVQSNGNGNNNTNMIEYPNGWYRCIYYENSNMTYSHIRIVDFDSDNEASSSSNTIYIWGLQAEVNTTFATSFIPSLSGTMPATNSTRAVDIAKITGINLTDFYNQPEGTIFADYKVIAGDPEIFYLSNNTSSKRIGLYEAGSNQTRFLIGNSGTQADTTSAATTVGDSIKAAGAYKLNDIVATKNGVISSTDGSATIPDGIDRAYIGGYFDGNVEGVLGLRKLSYYNKRLPNAQLQGLTQQ